jgi:hypothetical protein
VVAVLPSFDSIAAHVDVRWLLAGVLLHILSQAVRSRGWFNILRASYPHARELGGRHVMAASFAAAGLNGLLPARGGDVVKLAFVRRRIDGAHYPSLIATAVAETVFESLCGAALLVWLLARGWVPLPSVAGALSAAGTSMHPVVISLLALAAMVVSIAALRPLGRRFARVVSRWRRGLAIFSTPRRFVTQVASWQALARVIRLASLFCFLVAFALPATLGTAALVMAVQGGARVVPFAPVSAGMRIALLNCGIAGIAGHPVALTAIAAFMVGMSATTFSFMLAISAVLVGRELGTRSPRLALQRARVRLQSARV